VRLQLIYPALYQINSLTSGHNKERTVEKLAQYGATITYKEIQSIHGHDAFLLEYEQLNDRIQTLF